MEPRTREATTHGNPGHSRRQVHFRRRPRGAGRVTTACRRAQHPPGRSALAGQAQGACAAAAALGGAKPGRGPPRGPLAPPLARAASLLVGPHLEHPLGHAGLTHDLTFPKPGRGHRTGQQRLRKDQGKKSENLSKNQTPPGALGPWGLGENVPGTQFAELGQYPDKSGRVPRRPRSTARATFQDQVRT